MEHLEELTDIFTALADATRLKLVKMLVECSPGNVPAECGQDSCGGGPLCVNALAARLGIAVAEDRYQAGRARYVRLKGLRGNPPRATIYLRPDPRPQRCHWALAHEIGEHVTHQVFAALAIDPNEAAPTARETSACCPFDILILPHRSRGISARRLKACNVPWDREHSPFFPQAWQRKSPDRPWG